MSQATDDATRRDAQPNDGMPSMGRKAFGGPTASSWREQALTRIAELEDLTDAFRSPKDPRSELLAQRIHRHLETAREAAGGDTSGTLSRFRALLGGSPLERTASNVDAAEADLLRIAPTAYLHGQLPSLLNNARNHLKAEDPRLKQLEAICAVAGGKTLSETEKNAVIATSRAAASAARREMVQIRSFRNILYLATTLLALAATGLVILGAVNPRVLPLCFNPDDAVVCPTAVASPVPADISPEQLDDLMRATAQPWDIPLVAMLGLIAAAVSSAVALRRLRGTTTPYALPVALAVLKLPTGMLTAVLGLVLMRGDFVPGLSALDTPSQILAWAVLFGYAQQLFTRFVDERAHSVLDQVGAPDHAGGPDAAMVTRAAPIALDGGNGAPAVPTATKAP